MKYEIMQLSKEIKKCVNAHYRGVAGDRELNDQTEQFKQTKGSTLSHNT